MSAPSKPTRRSVFWCPICEHETDQHKVLTEQRTKVYVGRGNQYRDGTLTSEACQECNCVIWRHDE